jgi:hypothetical protein
MATRLSTRTSYVVTVAHPDGEQEYECERKNIKDAIGVAKELHGRNGRRAQIVEEITISRIVKTFFPKRSEKSKVKTPPDTDDACQE